MVLYGVLQNFATITEIIPYINDIFSAAAPNFYQISDGYSILIVEVAYGDSNNDTKRHFTYRVISKSGEYFTHTNTYLSPQFESLNVINGSLSAATRLSKITQYVLNNKNGYSNVQSWFLDTSSDVILPNNKNACQNTSIFRSNLQSLTRIYPEIKTYTVYGTVSNFIVTNSKNNSSRVYLRIIDYINVLKNGNQKITYSELNTTLADLFAINGLDFKQKTFIRQAPVNGICK